LIDLGGTPRTARITLPLVAIDKVVTTDAVERDGEPIVPEDQHTFSVAIRPHAIVTVRIVGKPSLHPPAE
jgi:hypothetical protein